MVAWDFKPYGFRATKYQKKNDLRGKRHGSQRGRFSHLRSGADVYTLLGDIDEAEGVSSAGRMVNEQTT